MHEVIGENQQTIYPRKPGTSLSNFVADLIKGAAEKEINKKDKASLPVIAVINIKGLRAPLPKGEIKIEDFKEAYNKNLDAVLKEVKKLIIDDNVKEIVDIVYDGMESDIDEIDIEDDKVRKFLFSLIDMQKLMDNCRLIGRDRDMWDKSFVRKLAVQESSFLNRFEVDGIEKLIMNIIDMLEEVEGDVVFEYIIRNNISRQKRRKVLQNLNLLSYLKGARLARVLSKIGNGEENLDLERYKTVYNKERGQVEINKNVNIDNNLLNRTDKVLKKVGGEYDS